MKKLYWAAATIGTILTPIAHEAATRQRGYTAMGGELFIIPLFMLIALFIQQMCEMVNAIKSMYEREMEEEKKKRTSSAVRRQRSQINNSIQPSYHKEHKI